MLLIHKKRLSQITLVSRAKSESNHADTLMNHERLYFTMQRVRENQNRFVHYIKYGQTKQKNIKLCFMFYQINLIQFIKNLYIVMIVYVKVLLYLKITNSMNGTIALSFWYSLKRLSHS